MKERNVVIAILVLLTLVIGLRITIFYRNKRTIEEEQLAKANNIINQENTNEIELVTQEELEENENIIGTIEIPKLNIIAPIQEGTDKEILKVAVGHFSESSFWNGNVALASHNRSAYVHYFEKINELQKGDEITYKTKMGTRKYIVYESREIESTDWSVIENTQENILTLITCISNSPEKRLCVRAREQGENVEEKIKQIESDNEIPDNKETIIPENVTQKEEPQENEEITEPEKIENNIESENNIVEEKEPEQIKLDFSKYDRYYPALNGGYTCFKKNETEIEKLKLIIEEAIQEFGYTNVKIVENSSINKDRYFTANKTNVRNLIYGVEGFTVYYYAETEYTLNASGEEAVFQIRSYIQIVGQ